MTSRRPWKASLSECMRMRSRSLLSMRRSVLSRALGPEFLDRRDALSAPVRRRRRQGPAAGDEGAPPPRGAATVVCSSLSIEAVPESDGGEAGKSVRRAAADEEEADSF